MKALSQSLISALRSRKKKDSWLEKKSGGFHIWGTLGFDVVILADGRMQSYEWKDGNDRKGTLNDIMDTPTRLTALRVAVRNIPHLKEIMPIYKGVPCPECSKLVDEDGIFQVCNACGGTGVTNGR